MPKDVNELSEEEFDAILDGIESGSLNDAEDTPKEGEPEDEIVELPSANNEQDDEDKDTESGTEEIANDGEDTKEGDVETDPDSNGDSDSSSDAAKGDSSDSDSSNSDDSNGGDINYEEEYKKLKEEYNGIKGFYDKVTSPFVAKGKKIDGITDPEKIIRGLQMSVGYTDKMRSFKSYRPYLTTLKEKGILENQDKFNLVIDAMEGKDGAIKQLLKNSNINPLDLEIGEDFSYVPGNNTASEIDIAFEDLMDASESAGVSDRVTNDVLNKWDDESISSLLSDRESMDDLVLHLSTGVYDIVMDRIKDKQMFDPDQTFSDKPLIEQYREAAHEVEQEYVAYTNSQKETENIGTQDNQVPKTTGNFFGSTGNGTAEFSEEEIQREMEKILKEQEYQSKVDENLARDKQRSSAASLSDAKKGGGRQNQQVYDPLEIPDDEFDKLFEGFLNT